MSNLDGYILALLQEHSGADHTIPAEVLASKASTFFDAKITGRDVRQVIHNLRQAGNPICRGQQGFYWPAELENVFACANYEFRSEARSMLLTARKLRNAGRALFGGQHRLF
jgi:hypothetical protein